MPPACTCDAASSSDLGGLLVDVGLEGGGALDVALGDDPALVGDLRDEVLVVRDADDGAVEVGDAVGEGLDGLEVEVVGRLVEDEDVGLDVRDGGERDARALAAREDGGGDVLEVGVGARDAAVGEVAAELEVVVVRAVAGEGGAHEVERRLVEVDLVGVVLVDEREARVRRAHDAARERLELAEEQPDERRLAVAVLADEDEPRPRRHAELDVLEEPGPRRRRGVVVEGDVAELDEVPREVAAVVEPQRQLGVFVEVRVVRVVRRRGELELVGLLLLHLHLVDLAVRPAVPEPVPRVLAQFVDLGLPLGLLAIPREFLLGAPREPRRVAPVRLREASRDARDVEHVRRDRLQEGAVVRDDDDDAVGPDVALAQLAREPHDGADRQVVRRLVQ
mmetsp:Transcript_7679/g.31759  ORF Transcript_7679/g.31759 Transcript_7679/m.31759 type:complete len:393 (-) Transcript_7679:1454-2632(-)